MNRDVFPCFVCDKGYKTRQALETHLFRSKKRCYLGVTPPGLDAYCLFNNRAFCTNCNLCVKNYQIQFLLSQSPNPNPHSST